MYIDVADYAEARGNIASICKMNYIWITLHYFSTWYLKEIGNLSHFSLAKIAENR